ncbi:transporter substrate-binding domain-containing protein [Agarivorans sp. B2Z047]|uniref:substrate-binding periplasmic protein n=1 Tax=Agarivorans sp. B2Z047 TaxID=2652721 RepID=UPI00128AE03C|nr:transporter substrate-binding domain-containing protein [Agarivorans sp. B2Z047]MPW31438.1 transporter substrate-binding domain-containing protein [Agarivorans sp. B2Z047]UQN42481.1 transporter substrate-binding domain-containing protein [Agarivorans sp. B2Z047]
MKLLLLATVLLIGLSTDTHAQKRLKYSSHPTEAPISWANEEGNLIGVGPKLVELIFDELGITTEPVLLPWKRAVSGAYQGSIDLINSIYFTEERADYLVYCDPYYSEDRIVIITNKENQLPLITLNELIGLTGGSIIGDSWGVEFDSFIANKLDIDKVKYFEQNIGKLLTGRIDYVIASEFNAKIQLAKLGYKDQFSLSFAPVKTEKVYMAFSKHSPFVKYLPQVNRKLQEMKDSGEIKQLEDYYLNKAYQD